MENVFSSVRKEKLKTIMQIENSETPLTKDSKTHLWGAQNSNYPSQAQVKLNVMHLRQGFRDQQISSSLCYKTELNNLRLKTSFHIK